MIDAVSDLVARAPEIRAEIDRLQRLLAVAEEFGAVADEETDREDQSNSSGRKSPSSHTPRTPARQGKDIASDEFVGLSATQAIKRYLEIVGRGNPKGPRDMAKALVAGGRDSDEERARVNVTSSLKLMKKNGVVRQVRRGQWGLSSWYGPARTTARPKGNGDDENGNDAE